MREETVKGGREKRETVRGDIEDERQIEKRWRDSERSGSREGETE